MSNLVVSPYVGATLAAKVVNGLAPGTITVNPDASKDKALTCESAAQLIVKAFNKYRTNLVTIKSTVEDTKPISLASFIAMLNLARSKVPAEWSEFKAVAAVTLPFPALSNTKGVEYQINNGTVMKLPDGSTSITATVPLNGIIRLKGTFDNFKVDSSLLPVSALADHGLKSANSTFRENKMTSISAGLFNNNTAITNFFYCFDGCASLTSIPAGLFDKSTAVTNFCNCFSYCTSLTAIPTGLFDKNTAVVEFGRCFYNCTGLTAIPAGLFDKNTVVSSFYASFQNCSKITSSVPALWTTTKWPKVTSSSYCFNSCTRASNYASIPAGWK